jgi:hypothetical protein
MQQNSNSNNEFRRDHSFYKPSFATLLHDAGGEIATANNSACHMHAFLQLLPTTLKELKYYNVVIRLNREQLIFYNLTVVDIQLPCVS